MYVCHFLLNITYLRYATEILAVIIAPSAAKPCQIVDDGQGFWLIDMVLRLRQHNIGYTADGFYRSDDPTNSVKALKKGG